MERRDFLKSALTLAALAPLTPLAAKAGADGDKSSDLMKGKGVVRRRYKDTALTVPLLGFGMMRLPRKDPDRPEIDYAVAQKMFDRAMAAGCNYFDTAYMYHGGLSEKCAGDLLSKYPRDSYYLVSKMPAWFAKKEADLEKIFSTQLARCRTDYFDFYMIHSLGEANWKLSQKFHVYEFLAKKKAEGKIRKLGFSFHDTPELLQKIVNAHPWDFAQIQLNYLDWELYRSKEQYEILTKAGIPVIVMEPLRGGALASLNPEATKILEQAAPGQSNASWAFRFAGSLPNVLTILSGMTFPQHLEDNIKTFTDFKPLSDADRKVLAQALVAYRKSLAVPCTACRYCLPCPAGVAIPTIFGAYNQYKISKNKFLFLGSYRTLPEESRASECVECGKCARHCPQHIDIPKELRKIQEEIDLISGKKKALVTPPDGDPHV